MIRLKKILKENNLDEAFADSTELQTTISYLKSKNKVLFKLKYVDLWLVIILLSNGKT